MVAAAGPGPETSARSEPANRPPRRPSPLVLAIIALGVLAGVCVTGGAVAGAWLTITKLRATAGPGHAVDVLLDDVEEGHSGTAYQRLCRTTRQNLTASEFDTLVRTEPRLISHRIVDSRLADTDGRHTATVTARLTLTSGPDSHTFPMVREDGAWRVCGDPF